MIGRYICIFGPIKVVKLLRILATATAPTRIHKRPVDSYSFEEVVIKLLHFQRSHSIVPNDSKMIGPIMSK